MTNIRNLEKKLWEAADLLRAGSKVTSQEYCMPVLGLIFLRYAFSRFKLVEKELLKSRPCRNGRVLPLEAADFKTKSAIFLPREAQYDYLVNLPDNVDIADAINHAMELVEKESSQLAGILPKNYSILQGELLRELLRTFNDSELNEIKDDVIGRIYEYFLNKFAPAVASDDGVFFTPKSLVRMIVNIIEPVRGTVLDPACGSGGMFVSSADFTEAAGINANSAMTFFGQEKVEYNAKLCIMNMAVHGLNAKIVYGDEANSFYHDAHSLAGCCDFVMANPPFNVDKVKSESCLNAGRLPFGLPGVNAKTKEVSNGNYLWISYFYAYLNETGRAGFVMASSATDSQGKDKEIRKKLLETGHVDVILSVGNNFFYTRSLPCTLWFFDKGKTEKLQDKVLFIDARNYFHVVDRTLNDWTPWQVRNLKAVVSLYRGEKEKYQGFLSDYLNELHAAAQNLRTTAESYRKILDEDRRGHFACGLDHLCDALQSVTLQKLEDPEELRAQLTANQTLANTCTGAILETLKDAPKPLVQQRLAAVGFSRLAGYKKALEMEGAIYSSAVQEIAEILQEANYLVSHFHDGQYTDVPGFCKIADRAEIAEKGYSLTPGAYVGVEEVKDDGVDFHARMREIHAELLDLQKQSNELMEKISKNFKEFGA